jgi:hypothetical protein
MNRKMRNWARVAFEMGRAEDGIALPMVLLATVLLLGLGMALSTSSMFELEVSSNHEREAQAFYAAQTGLERATDGFRTDFTVNNLPGNGALLYDHTAVSFPGSTVTADYTVTVGRRDSPNGSMIFPYPIFYTITSVGRLVPANPTVPPSSVTLTQTLSVTPRTLANYTLFYDDFDGALAFQSTFRLSGRMAVNDTRGVNTYAGTTVNGDFYSAGPINRNAPFGVPLVSGNIVENGGKVAFPATISPFSSGAVNPYRFTGTTRFIFANDGSVMIYNANLAGGGQTMTLPGNGIISVTGGDAIVEGLVHGRVTVACDSDILVNGNIRYADQSANSWDTLALVAQGDIVIPTNQYTATIGLTNFDANWNGGHWEADTISGGTWGAALPADVSIDATLISLTGSSPTVINPQGRLPGQLYVYGNSISKIASVTVQMSGNSVAHGLNENYMENKKLDMLPPPGFPQDVKLLPTFFAFREVRTSLK